MGRDRRNIGRQREGQKKHGEGQKKHGEAERGTEETWGGGRDGVGVNVEWFTSDGTKDRKFSSA